MSAEPSDAVVDAWIALNRAQQTAMRFVERAFRDADLPPYPWYDALWELDRAGEAGLRPGQIEQQMLIAQSNISRLIDRLEEGGYVERRRHEDDKRAQIIVITKAGRALRRQMWPVYAAAIQRAVGAHLSEREASMLAPVLSKLAVKAT